MVPWKKEDFYLGIKRFLELKGPDKIERYTKLGARAAQRKPQRLGGGRQERKAKEGPHSLEKVDPPGQGPTGRD